MTTAVKTYETGACAHAEIEALAAAVEAGGKPRGAFSAAELAKAASFPAPKRRRDWLAGRLAAKRLLARRWRAGGFAVSEDEIELLPAPDGIPELRLPARLAAAPRYALSITHSHGTGMTALGEPGTRIGIDLERIEAREGKFIELVAHESEITAALESDPVLQTRLWTLKEAVTKVLGTGMSVGFHDARFRTENGVVRVEFFREARARWVSIGSPEIFFDCETGPEDIVTVAYTKEMRHA